MHRRRLTQPALVLALSAGLTLVGSLARADEPKDRHQGWDRRGADSDHHDREHGDRDPDRGHGRDDEGRDRGHGWGRDDDHDGGWRSRDRDRGRDRDGGWQDRTRDDDRGWDGDRDRDDDWRRRDGRWDRDRRNWGRSGGSGWTYRYSYGGRYYDTGDDGAELLRTAVRYGYQQGLRAAQEARANRWDGYDYRRCDAYRDASYGYQYGDYVDAEQYRYYYRQGFERGYADGYRNARYDDERYDHRYRGVDVVVDILDLILDLHHIH